MLTGTAGTLRFAGVHEALLGHFLHSFRRLLHFTFYIPGIERNTLVHVQLFKKDVANLFGSDHCAGSRAKSC